MPQSKPKSMNRLSLNRPRSSFATVSCKVSKAWYLMWRYRHPMSLLLNNVIILTITSGVRVHSWRATRDSSSQYSPLRCVIDRVNIRRIPNNVEKTRAWKDMLNGFCWEAATELCTLYPPVWIHERNPSNLRINRSGSWIDRAPNAETIISSAKSSKSSRKPRGIYCVWTTRSFLVNLNSTSRLI